MCVLRVSLFGGVQITWLGDAKVIHLTPTIQLLLAYLLLNRHRTYPRDVLATLFWGEKSQEKARNSLKTAIWRLNKELVSPEEDENKYLITTQMGDVGFNRHSDYWLDVSVFEEQALQTLATPFIEATEASIKALEDTLQLYSGELLEGVYEEWAVRERERLHLLYISSLTYLFNYYRHHHVHEMCLVFGERILQVDPLREDLHREIMQIYLESGQRPLALRQYKICRKYLADELNIEPMEETEALYMHILAGKSDDSRDQTIDLNDLQDHLNQAVQQLHQAMRTIDAVREQFRQISHTLELLVRMRK